MSEESQTAEEESGSVPLYDSAADKPVIFTDGCIFAYSGASIVKLAFAESLIDPEGAPEPGTKNRVVGTLVMPKEGFLATLKYLNEQAVVLGLLEADGE